MIASIHQPNFLPWIGLFYKIINSDIFVLLDDVQYTKNSYINRNKIKTPKGEKWLTIPVKHTGHFGDLINEIIIDPSRKLEKTIKGILIENYKKAKYFEEVFNYLEFNFSSELNLACLNERFIKQICTYLEINVNIIKSSELNLTNYNSTDKLVNVCKVLGANKYLAGFGSKKYQESEKFDHAGIECQVYDFKHPDYPQLWGDFLPNLSIIDILFNCGKDSIDFIMNNK